MAINLRLLAAHPVTVFGGIACLLIGKTAILAGCGRYFGMSLVAATRAGMMLAPGGEFAFVAFKESVSQVSWSPFWWKRLRFFGGAKICGLSRGCVSM
jgi:Kef-type K+ transport system membrane component KefB